MAAHSEEYQKFVSQQAERLGVLGFDNDALLWHYTNGAGLLGILESGTIYSTQVSCLSDSTETRYATLLFQKALIEVLSTFSGDERVKKFLTRYVKLIEELPVVPSHAPSPFFVACFSKDEDSLGQWLKFKDECGYAIGCRAKNLFSLPNVLLRVNYDRELHEKIAMDAARATAAFFEVGLPANAEDLVKWEDDFLQEWDTRISYLTPTVKDPAFSLENEYRVLHEFTSSDLRQMKIVQKRTMMTRHIPLSFPLGGEAWVPRLPIEKVMVGPCRHPSITGISVDTLLRKMGYGSGKIVHSTRPLQET